MHIYPFPSGPLQTNAYVVVCPTTKEAAIIDPAPNSAENITAFVKSKGLHPKLIIITHSHWDHIADAAQLKEIYNIPVYVHPLDAPNLEDPGSDRLGHRNITPVTPSGFLNDGDIVKIGQLQLRVLHTPGHCRGAICLYSPENHCLISGDTLFKGSMGRIDLPTGQPDLMWKSLKRLAELPPETRVYPGHGPTTTIGAESWLSNAETLFQ